MRYLRVHLLRQILQPFDEFTHSVRTVCQGGLHIDKPSVKAAPFGDANKLIGVEKSITVDAIQEFKELTLTCIPLDDKGALQNMMGG
jgi:hypothetical protein